MFDTKSFMEEQFDARTAVVQLPALAQWYKDVPDGEVPSFTVRGLTGAELAKAEETATKGRDSTAAILETLRKANRMEGIEELERSLGVDSKVPLKLALKMEHVVMAVVEPKLSLQVVVKLASVFPIEFEILHLKIQELTGNGQVAAKKAKPSGEDQTSVPQ
jgi:hypothetical protein